MKNSLTFISKFAVISFLLSQTYVYAIGGEVSIGALSYQLPSNALEEPIFLSLCGLALLSFGLFRNQKI